MKSLNQLQFENAASKAVKLPTHGWVVYKHYEICEEGDEAFVVAPVESWLKPEPVKKGSEVRHYRLRDPQEDAMTIYAPLTTPELVLDLAELAEKEITPEAVLRWAETYGLLGFEDEDIVGSPDGIVVKRWGRRDNVRRFAEAAEEVRGCLRIYEAITADEDLNLEELSSYTMLLPHKARMPYGSVEENAGKERSWLARVLGYLVQMRLNEYCYPVFVTYVRGGEATGRFSLSLGFRNLIGAIWMQIAWLMESEGSVQRCKLPGCLRIIRFEPGKSAEELGLIKDEDGEFRKNARGKYKTRTDREFCKGRGHKQKYNYRKRRGWPGYF